MEQHENERRNKFKDYKIVGKIYLTEDTATYLVKSKIGKYFILKHVMRPPEITRRDGTKTDRLQIEERGVMAWRDLSHPALVSVVDYWRADDDFFVVTDRVKGVSLTERLGTFTEEGAIQETLKICEGIACYQQKKIVHRDLKPDNIILAEYGPVIIDPGFATVVSDSSASVIVGTDGYFRQSRIADIGYTFATDLHSLGVILYEMVNGPKQDTQAAPDADGLSKGLADVIAKAYNHHYRAVQEMVSDLEIALANLQRRRCRIIRRCALVMLFVVLTVYLGAKWKTYSAEPQEIKSFVPVGHAEETNSRSERFRAQYDSVYEEAKSLAESNQLEKTKEEKMASCQRELKELRQALNENRLDDVRKPKRQLIETLAPNRSLDAQNLLSEVRAVDIPSLFGALVITTKPPHAKTYLDTDEKGASPLTIAKAPPGQNRLAVVAPPGYVDQTITVQKAAPLPEGVVAIKSGTAAGSGLPLRVTNTKDGSELVLVPAGEFTMGSNDGFDDEKPSHKMHLDAFYIDKYEVSNAQYSKFLVSSEAKEHSKCHPGEPKGKDHTPRCWNDSRFNKDNYPVVGIDWFDAYAYAAWSGKLLPTEAQWEKAARGADGRKYPWGNEAPDTGDEHRANYDPKDDGHEYTAPVDSFGLGQSPYGCYNMAGNAWEWCANWYAKDYGGASAKSSKGHTSRRSGRRTPIRKLRDYIGKKRGRKKASSDVTYRALRGGSWISYKNLIRSASRYYYPPGYWNFSVGFRCCRNFQ